MSTKEMDLISQDLKRLKNTLESWIPLRGAKEMGIKAQDEAKTVTQQDLHDAAHNVHSYTTKFSVAYAVPESDILYDHTHPFAEFWEGALWTLYSFSSFVVDSPHYSSTLKKEIKSKMANVIESCVELASAHEKERGDRKVSAHLTGKVWKSCEDFQKFQLDNRIALSKVIGNLLPLVKDAASEMEDLQKESNSLRSSKSSLEEGDDRDFEDEFDDSPDLSEENFKAIPHIISLFKCAFSLLKKSDEIVNLLQIEADQTFSRDAIESMDRIEEKCAKIVEIVDQLGSGIYEDDWDLTRSEGENLSNQMLELLDIYRGINAKSNRGEEVMQGNNKFFQLLKGKVEETRANLDSISSSD
eukprot:TRINITY_DN15076_c0_g1_i1.p1 TRINITY_DN15076_c0_g1~~TRINITY_DN15076_c0_g1_i1.p1  ORF type:complete len:357 (+),score=141.50 TRINITY_DN15076_c0_g1_i1:42-1112(+)